MRNELRARKDVVYYDQSMIVTILIFILVLAVLVLVHEAGHFFAARKAGIRVDEFGFGFPPRAVGIKRGETIFSLNWIPLGGFVKIFGEEGEGSDDPTSFIAKPVWIRVIVIVAGVAMNMLLAWLLFSFGHVIGLPTILDEAEDITNVRDVKIQVVEVAPESPALAAELAIGDVIVGLDGNAIENIDAIQSYVASHKGAEITLRVERGIEQVDLRMTPRIDPPQGQGPLGFAMAQTGIRSLPIHKAIIEGAKDTAALAWLILKSLGNLVVQLVRHGTVADRVSGPLGIVVFTDMVVQRGFTYLLQFAGIISVSLGVLNLLPIPALDGGRLLFLAIEKIKGRRVSPVLEAKIHGIAFILLLMLMLLITIKWDLPLFVEHFF
ncbi:MAG: M50 family metallopeptidase [bacterium]|nr:M50 family metallopeptidase [bacterium]